MQFLRAFQSLRQSVAAKKYLREIYQKPKKGKAVPKELIQTLLSEKEIKNKIKTSLQNIQFNIPQIFGGLIFVLTIPQCYYFYTLIMKNYHEKKLWQNIRKSVDALNIKTAVITGAIFGLQSIQFNFRNKKLNKMPSKYVYLLLQIPYLLQLLSLSYVNLPDKHMIYTTAAANLSCLGFEIKFVTQGAIPHWLFNIRFQAHVFDFFFMILLYYSIKNLQLDMAENPQLYPVDYIY